MNADPPDEWERTWNERVLDVQGNLNPFVGRGSKGAAQIPQKTGKTYRKPLGLALPRAQSDGQMASFCNSVTRASITSSGEV